VVTGRRGAAGGVGMRKGKGEKREERREKREERREKSETSY
jgi:hypothetical protein